MTSRFDKYRAPDHMQPRIEKPKQTGDFGEQLKKIVQQQLMGGVSNIGQQVTNAATSGFDESNRETARGIAEGVPKALFSSYSGLSDLFGGEQLPKMQQEPSQSWPQTIGREIGEAGTYGLAAAPAALAGEGFAPAIAASGAIGAALTPGNWKDRLAGGAEFAAPVAAGKGLAALGEVTAKNVVPALRKVDPEQTYGKIIKAHDTYKQKLGNLFKFVEKEADSRGIKNVGELDDELFEQAKEYGHRTKSFNRILDKAKKGDYKDVRALYSELGRQERLAIKSKNYEKAEGLRDSQNMINEGLAEHFRQTGNPDLAKWLDTTKVGYAKLKQMFEPQKNATLRKLVDTEERVIPDDLTPLMKNRTSVKRLLKAFPEVEKDVKAVKAKEKLKDTYHKVKKAATYSALLHAGSRVGKSHHED